MAESAEHPMVAVPDAVRTVLRESLRSVLERPLPSSDVASPDGPWNELAGRILDENVVMSEPGYPPYNASVMDGYAIRTRDGVVAGHDGWTHTVVDRVHAGSGNVVLETAAPSGGTEAPVACYVATGAVVPDSCDCVVPVEQCRVSEEKTNVAVLPSATVAPGRYVRKIGCDIPAGTVVLSQGSVLDPVSLGLLKQSGVDSVRLKPTIRIGVLSTGNELLHSNKEATRAGQIPDVNRPVLLSLLSTFGNCTPVDLGIRRDDDIDGMANCVRRALSRCDVIITTGGISMGETDIVEDVLVQKCGGTLHFGRMHMKPGKPTTFVTIPHGDRTVLTFAMPGNPVSGTVCTQLLVRPCIDVLSRVDAGTQRDAILSEHSHLSDETLDKLTESAAVHPEVGGVLSHDVTLDFERPEYRRVVVDRFTNGKFYVSSTGVQRSSRLMSLLGADGLLVLPQATNGRNKARAGESYPLLLVSQNPHSGAFKRTKVADSKHLNNVKISPAEQSGHRVSVVYVIPENMTDDSGLADDVAERIEQSLSGSKSGSARIVSSRTTRVSSSALYEDLSVEAERADFVVLACISQKGSLTDHLAFCSKLLRILAKPSDAISQQIRQGAASVDPLAALYEVVVGFLPSNTGGAMIVCLSDKGIDGGLGNVRGLLKHSLNVARGRHHAAHH